MSQAAPQKMTLASLQNPANQIAQLPDVAPGFGNLQAFELAQRAANLLANSTLVPAAYRRFSEDRNGVVSENTNALSNCVVALNMAQRMRADPLMIMQNMHIVEGRPSWSSQFIIAAINETGRFSPLRFKIERDDFETEVEFVTYEWRTQANGKNKKEAVHGKTRIKDVRCTAWAIEKETGEKLESPTVSLALAIKEGWLTRNGSKWQTMPDLMMMYRAGAFFGRLYAPEILMGFPSADELEDVIDVTAREAAPPPIVTPADARAQAAETSAKPEEKTPEPPPNSAEPPAPTPAPAPPPKATETSDSGPPFDLAPSPPPPPPPAEDSKPREDALGPNPGRTVKAKVGGFKLD